jgi:hypothetical protein
MADRVAKVPAVSMRAAGDALVDVARDEARRAGIARVHVTRRGRPPRAVALTAVVDVEARPGTAAARVQALPVGPWVWANTGTARHVIGKGRPGHPVVLSFGRDRVATGPVPHPGVRGRGVWRRVQRRAPALGRAAVVDAAREAVRRG